MRNASDSAASGDADGMTLEGGAIAFALRELSVSFQLYERHLAQLMHLKPAEYQAMAHILDGGGSLGPLDLAARIGLAPGTTSELLDRLQHLGHVVREKDDIDRRRVKLVPTTETTRQIVSILSAPTNDLSLMAEEFEPSEQDAILRFLHRASATLRSHADPEDHASQPYVETEKP